MEAKAKTAMVCLSEGMTLTIQLKPMTVSNITATNTADRSMFRTAAVGIAAAMAPLAVVIGVAAMSIPAAEARYTQCHRIGNSVICNSF